MPNCFTLTKKDEAKPRPLKDIDTDLWDHFEGGEPDGNEQWYHHWYNFIGLLLAVGKTFQEVIKLCEDFTMREIAVYLEENYTSNAWYERK